MEIVGICRATIVYDYCDDRIRLEEFERIANSKQEASHPWILVGYFDDRLSSDEKNGGKEFDHNCANTFRRFINNYDVMDVKASGSFFTWRNGLEP